MSFGSDHMLAKDYFYSSNRVDEAIEACEEIFGSPSGGRRVPFAMVEQCLFDQLNKMAKEKDGVELVFPRPLE
nr:unnamed protein product [Spirometra erinaceieuropaei]